MHTNTNTPEIDECDYVICSARGANYHCAQLGLLSADYDAMLQAIHADMQRAQFWPNVWFVNDHGNVDLLTLKTEGGRVVGEIFESWI